MAFWSQTDVQELLCDTLDFLSNDKFKFDFRPVGALPKRQEYIEDGGYPDWPFYDADRVIMFSGGLDSLSGAVRTASAGEKLILVSHRPVTTQGSRQRQLFEQLKAAYPSTKMIHVPVQINKNQNLKGDNFQRTRSFLFSALGAIVAASVRAKGVRFFENGVVSLNLPVAGETVGARASRTTHPIALHNFSKLYEKVLGRSLIVDNPYLHLTKREVLDEITRCGRQALIGHTCSCAHQGYGQPRLSPHCGTCSQCIDRRFAILAAGLQEYDAESDYRSNVFTGPRKPGYEQSMAINYVRHASAMKEMSDEQLATQFNMELVRATRFVPRKSQEARQLIDMHKRHANSVCETLAGQIGKEAERYINGSLGSASLLKLVAGGEHQRPSWELLGNRITAVLQAGLPVACQKEKPKTEPALQVICDSLLKSAEVDLDREYPFLKWAWGTTKPDWSSGPHRLWVELKYVRKTSNSATIAEAIAADITRYGDNGQRVQFIVYDPQHLIPRDSEFSERVTRSGVRVSIIR